MRPVKSLKPYDKNARKHSPDQVGQIVALIERYGWTNPIILDDAGMILAGHGRLLAAKKMGVADVPCVTVPGLTDAEKRAYVLADNQSTLNGEWDTDLLRAELGELSAAGFDMDLIGFPNLEALLATGTAGLTDPDDTPETPVEAVTEPGDVWLLGRHRIVCGDSTDADTVAKCLNGVVPHLMVTDPPYGVEYDANWRNDALAGKPRANGKIGGGGRAVGKVKNDGEADWREAWALFPGDVVYIWHAGTKAHIVAESLEAAGFGIRAQIIWNKSNLVIGRGDYHPKHEPCWYAVRKGKTGHWAGGRKQTTVWDIDKPQKSETGHSTQKPVECMKRPIENNSSAGQAVYEPFSGSGTTIIAAEMTGRACHAIELHPPYVDVAVTRWAEFTGETPKLEATGQTFAEVMAQRRPDQTPKAKVAPKPKAT